MRFGPITLRDRTGQDVLLRNAEGSDAAALLAYLKATAAETPYLIREPDEITLSEEDERRFLEEKAESPRDLMLTAWVDGAHAGNCSLMSMGSARRYAHRCGIALALYRAYWGRGIGALLLDTVLEAARGIGYEQAELEVAAGNRRAITLYDKMGFQRYGILPNNMKYPDGSVCDALWMMKTL